MKYILPFVLCFFISTKLFCQDSMFLWPQGKIPNTKSVQITDSTDKDFIFHVAAPRMYSYFAAKEKNTGAAILIVPGGGYLRLPARYNAIATALYYQSMGINAFVLCHRLPLSPNLIKPEIAPLQDAQRAMRIIRANAAKWNIDPKRIGVGGASAGGHVSSTLGTHDEDVSSIGDEFDQYSFRPSFMILISAVISFKPDIAHKGSRDRLLRGNLTDSLVNAFSNETRITKETPTTLLIHANDDNTVSSLNSIAFYQAMKKAKLSSSLHIFPYGGHGLSVDKSPGSALLWPKLTIEWLKEMKFIE